MQLPYSVLSEHQACFPICSVRLKHDETKYRVVSKEQSAKLSHSSLVCNQLIVRRINIVGIVTR